MSSKYDGFISYSHATDSGLAPALQRALQMLVKPWYRLRALHIFRDETSLSANPALWPSIEDALSKSRWFIYMASPAAAQSPWVAREVEWWLTHRDQASLLIVLTDGSIRWNDDGRDFDWSVTDAVPRLLSGKLGMEPLWVDLSWSRRVDNLSLHHSQFRSAVLKVAAPLHGRAPEDLDGEDVRQFRRTRHIAVGVSVALALLTIGSLVSAYFAVQRSRESVSRELAMQSLQELAGDPELSLRLAMHAVDSAWTEQAETALRRALGESKVRATLQAPTQVGTAAYSSDGTTVAVRSGREVALLAHGRRRILEHPELVGPIGFSGNGGRIATGSWDGRARIWNVESATLVCDAKTALDEVERVELNADASLLLTVARSRQPAPVNVVQVWDARSCELVSELKGHTAAVAASTFDPTGTKIATGSYDGSARLWQASTGAPLRAFIGHTSVVQSIAFSQDGAFVFTAGADLAVRTWDAATGAMTVVSGEQARPMTLAEAQRRLVAVHPAGVAFISDGNRASVHDARAGRTLQEIADFPSSCWRAVFSADARLLACPSKDGAAFVWDVATGMRIAEFRGHKGELNDVVFSPDGRSLLSCGTDDTARSWIIDDGGRDVILGGHEGAVTNARWSSNGRLVATASEGTTRVWNASTGKSISTAPGPGRVASISFADDDRRLAVSRYDAPAQVWDIKTAADSTALEMNAPEFFPSWSNTPPTDWSPDGRIVITASSKLSNPNAGAPSSTAGPVPEPETRLLRWDAASGRALPWIAAGRDGLCGYSQETGAVCLGTEDERVARIWDVRAGKMVAELRGHLPAARLGAMSKDGHWVALSNQEAVEIWETGPARLRARLAVPSRFFTTSLEFDETGSRLVTGGGQADPVARIWSTQSGKLLRELRGHSHSTTAARFSSNGKLVATSSQDNTVRIWDVASGRTLTMLRGHRDMVQDARFSPDGRKVLTASSDGTARIYDISFAKSLEELMRVARERGPRTLTPEERREYHL